MNLSTQKLSIDEKADEIQKIIDELSTNRKILIRAMEEIDNGQDMFSGSGILAQEVRRIMKISLIP